MSDGRLVIDLIPEVDRNGNKYFIGRIKAPVLIDCSENESGGGGVCFMIFTSVDGEEQMQISHIRSSKPKKLENGK